MKRLIFCVLLLLVPVFGLFAQKMVWTKHYQDYFDKYKDLAIEQMQKHKIPASITLAQGVLESAAGRSELAVKGNNHFGVMVGRAGRPIMTMMPGRSASVHTIMFTKVTRTTPRF